MESMHNVDASLLFSAKDGRQSRLLQELREKQQQLVQASKLASMGELSSGIAHELNNPLFVISGLTEVMQMQLQRKHPEAYDSVAKSFETMLIATEKMRDIINHIRIFARQEQMQFIPYSLNEIIISGLLLIEQQLKQHDIQVKLNLIENSPVVLCAPNRLEQVIINLFSNARDAIESRRHQEPNHTGVITVSTESNLDQAIIRFRDNGTGIDEESAKKLYDPFYSTKEVGKGTGLGLSISYGIIQEHNATIEMSSALGEFTEFVLTFNPISD
jgi:histidine kinase